MEGQLKYNKILHGLPLDVGIIYCLVAKLSLTLLQHHEL